MLHLKRGFTFLEILIVLFILGLIGGIILPNLIGRLPGYKRREFVAKVGALVGFAWQNALAEQKAHRLFFDFTKRTISVQIETDKKDREGKPTFRMVNVPYFNAVYTWSENIVMRQFFVEGTDLFSRAGLKAETAQTAWFYVAPDGLVQPTALNFIDSASTDARGNPIQLSLVINPFTAQIKTYDTFQKA